ncbi:MAG: MurR/RpiR family transcriptional regulator [Nonomuraea sp.]|nr:MurR/RpiR family transcriptional regulator [Nonomuraea sp.]
MAASGGMTHTAQVPTVLEKIAAARPTFSATLIRVADVVSGHPEFTAGVGSVELAQTAGTSVGTVNRFCRAIGLDGYTALRLALASELGQAAADLDADPTGEIEPSAGARDTVNLIAASSINAIRRTATLLDTEALGRLAAAVDEARQVQIFAFGGSAQIARYLADQLVGIGIVTLTSPDVTTAAAYAVTLGAGDVAIAISHSGTAQHALDLLSVARERGAFTAGITSSAYAPLVTEADLTLVTTARSATARYRGTAGRHAQLFVTDALYVRVSQRRASEATRLLDLAGQATAPYQTQPRDHRARQYVSGQTVASGTAARTPVAVTDQASRHILVLDPDRDWAEESAVLWRWQPDADSGVEDPQGSWRLPTDARLRHDASTGRQYVLVSDSCGLLAAVPYPQGGAVAWSVNAGAAANPHGVERLPDGNVAAAASTGGWVRVYTASQGPRSHGYAEDLLPGAHEVLWRDDMRALWAVGDDLLVRYDVGGTSASPTLRRRASYDLPSAGGHDLQPVAGDPRRLWVTTVDGVYQFDVVDGAFVAGPPQGTALDRPNVKSVGTDSRSGVVLQTTPKPGNESDWCTDEVDFYAGGSPEGSRRLPGAQIYRARWFSPDSH